MLLKGIGAAVAGVAVGGLAGTIIVSVMGVNKVKKAVDLEVDIAVNDSNEFSKEEVCELKESALSKALDMVKATIDQAAQESRAKQRIREQNMTEGTRLPNGMDGECQCQN